MVRRRWWDYIHCSVVPMILVHSICFLQAPKARSKTVIVAKNLPAKTTASEIREMFCRFGELGRVILPPIGVTGKSYFYEMCKHT